MAISKRKVGKAFGRHADEYDRHAIVQKWVVRRLEQLVVQNLEAAPARMLDIGCGTGALFSGLQKLYPLAKGYGIDLAFSMAEHTAARFGEAFIINGDAENLPFKDNSFDLVASASTFQWVLSLERCFGECRRVLSPGGMLCAAFYGGRTLWELQESYRQAALQNGAGAASRIARLHRFKAIAEVSSALAAQGFEELLLATETETEQHSDVAALLRSIKGIGAGTAMGGGDGGLGGRSVIRDMSAIYESLFRADGYVPATYEIIYIVARRG